MASGAVWLFATMDTKGEELLFLAEQVRAAGARTVVVDVGVANDSPWPADVSRHEVAACHPEGPAAVFRDGDRGGSIAGMAAALAAYLPGRFAAGAVAAVAGLGGSGGTALLAPAFQALPVGVPKLLLSTVAAGNVAGYVGCSDLALMPSVADISGLNRVTRAVLRNAAYAVAGMAQAPPLAGDSRPAVALTMFGVTTPCVTAVRQRLESAGWDALVFHATGVGGQAMEKLVASGMVAGVLDVTTTEVADEVVGGCFPAGPARFDAILAAGIPYVLSLGALDMVNFGPMESVPERFRGRRLHTHNSQVTLMRTTPEECAACGRWIADKLNRATAPWTLLMPSRGLSALDAEGQPFHDPVADACLFASLHASLQPGPGRKIELLPLHINDPAFAAALADEFAALAAAA